jgi:hypothetical protein
MTINHHVPRPCNACGTLSNRLTGKLVNNCCGERPIIWEPDPFEVTNIEKIECYICGRVIYGSEEESIEEWNNGGNDDVQ